MGLDMYAYRVEGGLLADAQVDFRHLLLDDDGDLLDGVDTEFAYWRKFNALHGWMENLYQSKGGVEPSFNTDYVRIESADLDKLMADLDSLTPVAGFFFGSMDPVSENDKEVVRAFVAKAREALSEGDDIVYTSWW